MKEHRAKFRSKITAWCGSCNWRVKFNFIIPYKLKDPKKDKDGKKVKGDKEYEKWSDKEKKEYKAYQLTSHLRGMYQCSDCEELKVLEFPEPI